MPVLRGLTLNTPKRRSSMRSPRPSAVFIASKTVSSACSALVRDTFVLETIALTISSLITNPPAPQGQKSMLDKGFADCQGAAQKQWRGRKCGRFSFVVFSGGGIDR